MSYTATQQGDSGAEVRLTKYLIALINDAVISNMVGVPEENV